MSGKRIAVIGSGISGLASAWMLAAEHQVTLFEGDTRFGGHSNTIDVRLPGEARSYPVDTGFIVFNHQTYPLFARLLRHLDVATHASHMSFAVRDDHFDMEYCGSDSLAGLFAQPRNILRPRFWRMLSDILRFYREAPAYLASDEADRPMAAWLAERGYSRAFTEGHLIPMSAAIWSAPPHQVARFPMRYLCRFLANHGMMQLADRPQWYTVSGGSREYVAALHQRFAGSSRRGDPVRWVRRGGAGVELHCASGHREHFDEVVLAVHADQALAMLADADAEERRVLGSFPYQPNEAVLHSDIRALPRRRAAWGAWNYHRPRARSGRATLTYHLSMLQGHQARLPFLVSLNPSCPLDHGLVHRRIQYAHPLYSARAFAAQDQWAQISGRRRVHFCGAYWGYGFHEDGLRSAQRVAQHFAIDPFADPAFGADPMEVHRA